MSPKAQYDAAIQQLTGAGAPFEITTADINGVTFKVYKNTPQSMRDLLAAGRAHGGSVFLIYEGERWTFDDFWRQVDAIGYQLVHKYGIGKGDRVAIAMRNYPEWMTAFVATASIGAVVVPLNSWGQAQELEYGLTDAGAKVVFCDQQRYDLIAPSLPAQGVRAIVARATDTIDSACGESLAGMISGAEGKALPECSVGPQDPAMIMYTSGTTGKPKGAVSTQQNLIQAIMNFEVIGYATAMTNPNSIEKMLSQGHPPAALLCLPLFHVSGCHSVFLLSLRAGRRIVIMHKWDVKRALELIEQERVATISAVPSMTYEMLLSDELAKHDISSLFSYGSGGTASPAKLPDLIYKTSPDSFPGGGFGMTETNGSGTSAAGELYRHRKNSAGVAGPIMEVEVRDDDGNVLPHNERGNIFLKGPTVVSHYWNKPEASAETFSAGWVKTGDVGYLDEEGYLFIVDRVKDMVIRGGENIYSAEIEHLLHQHPAVLDVAAYGVPHEVLGEELAVSIILRPGHSSSTEAVQTFVGEHLARFKVPTFVEFRDEFPKNATGKVLKRTLREEMTQTLGRA